MHWFLRLLHCVCFEMLQQIQSRCDGCSTDGHGVAGQRPVLICNFGVAVEIHGDKLCAEPN